jgi:hypothetical protein
MKHKKFISVIVFTILIVIAALLYVYKKDTTDTITLYYDKSYIENKVNISDIESCVYTEIVAGNPRSIGPCDYEDYVFIKCSNDEISRIKNTYTFKECEPDFRIRPQDSKYKSMSFRDNEVLGNYNFCWGIAKNLKMM